MAKSEKTDEINSRTNQRVSAMPWNVTNHDDYETLRTKLAELPKIPTLVNVNDAETTTAPGRTYNWLLTSEQSGGSIAIHRMTLEPGFVAADHHHPAEEEFFFVLEGELEITIGNTTRIAGPGTFGYAPPHSTHAFKTHGDKPCKVLHWNSPGGHERVGAALKKLEQDGRTTGPERHETFKNHDYIFHDESRFADPPSSK
jgi:quercetin dioxygenase-like cupin family protein